MERDTLAAKTGARIQTSMKICTYNIIITKQVNSVFFCSAESSVKTMSICLSTGSSTDTNATLIHSSFDFLGTNLQIMFLKSFHSSTLSCRKVDILPACKKLKPSLHTFLSVYSISLMKPTILKMLLCQTNWERGLTRQLAKEQATFIIYKETKSFTIVTTSPPT